MSNNDYKTTASESGSGRLIAGIAIGCGCSLLMAVVLVVVGAIWCSSMMFLKIEPTYHPPQSMYLPPEDAIPESIFTPLPTNDESPYVSTYKDIFEASRLGFVQDVKYFVEKGVNVNARGVNIYEDNKTGVTPLHFAAKYNTNVDVLKYLIDQGADRHAQTNVGSTPLHYAAAHNSNSAVFGYMIEKGADINARNMYGVTPLHLTARVSSDVTKYLIEQGAEINAKDNASRTPIDFARAMNREDCEIVLREAGGKSGEELKDQEQHSE